jgi:spore coat protein U-like protein
MRRFVILGALIGVAGAPLALSAADATASLTVSASVSNNCTVSTSALTFAAYDPVVAMARAV